MHHYLPALLFAAFALVPHVAAAEAPLAAAQKPVVLRFAASVGDKPFACGSTYTKVGANKVSWTPQDLRFYVSEVALRKADGTLVPVTLTSDGTWQDKEVALLDFEDRSGACQNGTPATHTQIDGTVADDAGAVGLQFTVGVPFAANHADASTQDPPLDQAGLFWGWQMGHKFFNLEGRVDNKSSHTVHIGSTGCTMSAPNKVAACSAINDVHVVLQKFDAKTQRVHLDVAQLLADSKLGKGAAGKDSCMSEHDNPNCARIFARLGLAHPKGAAAAKQSVFTAR